MPKPISCWINALIKQSWNLLLNRCLKFINKAWHDNVLKEFHKNIMKKFPIKMKAKSSISIANFSHFFGPNGTLNDFFKKYLQNFINTTNPTWTLVRFDNQTLPISSKIINLFNRAQKIQNLYFTESKQIPSLNFTVEPYTLSSNTRKIKLTIGNQIITYQHGPTTPTIIHWPLTTSSSVTKIIMTSFSDRNNIQSYNGPWSWFQFLLHTKYYLTNKTAPQSIIIVIKSHHQHASFKIKNSNIDQILFFNSIKKFHPT